MKLYLLDDAEQLTTPERVDVQYWDGSGWNMLPKEQRKPAALMGHRANTFSFREIATSKLKSASYPSRGRQWALRKLRHGETPPCPYPPLHLRRRTRRAARLTRARNFSNKEFQECSLEETLLFSASNLVATWAGAQISASMLSEK